MSTPTPPMRRAGRVALVAGLVVAAYAGGVVTGVVGSSGGSGTASSSVLDEAADRIMAEAAKPVSRQKLDQAAVEGMLKALGDRWSAYFTPPEFSSFADGLDGRYSGIGVWLRSALVGVLAVTFSALLPLAGFLGVRGGLPTSLLGRDALRPFRLAFDPVHKLVSFEPAEN